LCRIVIIIDIMLRCPNILSWVKAKRNVEATQVLFSILKLYNCAFSILKIASARYLVFIINISLVFQDTGLLLTHNDNDP
jgi:hypothetical protein